MSQATLSKLDAAPWVLPQDLSAWKRAGLTRAAIHALLSLRSAFWPGRPFVVDAASLASRLSITRASAVSALRQIRQAGLAEVERIRPLGTYRVTLLYPKMMEETE